MLHSKTAASSSTVVTQTTVTPSPANSLIPLPSVPHPSVQQHTTSSSHAGANTNHQQTPPNSSAPTTPAVSSAQVPNYGKPRLLPSPYGPPPLPITTASDASGSAGGNGRGNSHRGPRTSNPPPKKIIPVSILIFLLSVGSV